MSLGVVLDTSDSMDGEKIQAAKAALNRFLYDLLDPQDEIFLYTFDDDPRLLQGWTTDRQALSRSISRIRTDGATAMYDAVAEAIPLASTGRHQKKAIVLISDGNDTSSHTPLVDLKQLVRESEVMIYAIGIDGAGTGRRWAGAAAAARADAADADPVSRGATTARGPATDSVAATPRGRRRRQRSGQRRCAPGLDR